MTFDQWLQTEAHPHLRDAGPLGTEWIRQIYEAGQRNVLPAQAEQRGEVVGWLYRGGGPRPVSDRDEWKYWHGSERPVLSWDHQEIKPAYTAPPAPDGVAKMRELLRRYRTETPLCHQPHMIALEVDELLAAAPTVAARP